MFLPCLSYKRFLYVVFVKDFVLKIDFQSHTIQPLSYVWSLMSNNHPTRCNAPFSYYHMIVTLSTWHPYVFMISIRSVTGRVHGVTISRIPTQITNGVSIDEGRIT